MRTLRPGSTLGRYTIVDRIGAGGMAELHLARIRGAASFQKSAAIKVIHPHLIDDQQSIKMFMREAKIAAQLDHPNIVRVLDFGCDAGEYYLAMEYVHGLDLRQIRSALGDAVPVPLPVALAIIVSVADALHFAHTVRSRRGEVLQIVHRDVSPSNIMLGHGGAVKLADFGIAKLASHGTGTGTGVIKGKPGYMAPEQCLGEVLDARCDVFSLGIVLYELTTGQRAFAALNPAAAMNRVLEGEYAPPQSLRADYPLALAAIVAAAMQTEPQQRTPSAGVLAAQLRELALQSGFSLSQASVAQWLATHFGEPPPPSLDVDADILGLTALHPAGAPDQTTEISPTSAPWRQSRARSRVGGLLLGTGGLGLGVALGLSLAAGPAASEARAVPVKVAPSAPVAGRAASPPPPAPRAGAVPAEVAVAPPATDAPTPSVAAPREAAPHRSRAKKKKKNKRGGGSTSPPADAAPRRDAMFPSSARSDADRETSR